MRLEDQFEYLEELARGDDGQLPQAKAELTAWVNANPNDVSALELLGNVYLRLRQYDNAEKYLTRALVLSPDLETARWMLAGAFFHREDWTKALAETDTLLTSEPDRPDYIELRAYCLLNLGRTDEALASYRALTSQHPTARHWHAYGHALKTLGQYEEAVAALHRSLAFDPGFGDAWWTLAGLRRFRFTSNDVEIMRVQLARVDLDTENRIRIHHALGKALEDAQDYKASFAQYERGNMLRRVRHPYDRNAAADALKRAKAVFTHQLFAANVDSGCKTRGPIFVVGMTRAGSTLVEQILASHSMVEGTRELQIINRLLERLNDPSRSAMPYPEVLKTLSRKNLSELGEEYMARARDYRKTDRAFFIDKMPGNAHHLAFIHLILPEAKIIDARRHPLACGFANFRQYYRHGQNFASELGDIGHFYRDYVEVMAHYDAVLPGGAIYRVFYEALVRDPEAEVRRLLGHLNLPFEENCLRFYETKRAVFTPSAEQVRQPIFTQGLKQWQNFEPWLAPLKAALGDALSLYPAVPKFENASVPSMMRWSSSAHFTV